jgi:hypothetical protein
MAESLIEHNYETEQISINDTLPDLKNSIKSSFIKDILKEEDNNVEINSKKEKEKEKNRVIGNKSKNKNKEVSKSKKNNDMNNAQFQLEIKKVRPKSKTIKKLINDQQNKSFIKSKKNKNKINRETKQNLTNIIDTKSASTKKINIKMNNINNNKPKENNIKAKEKIINISHDNIKASNINLNLNSVPNKKTQNTNEQKNKNETERTKPKSEFLNNNDLKFENIKNNDKKPISELNNKIKIDKSKYQKSESILKKANIINNNNNFSEKNVQDFVSFLSSNESNENNQMINKTLDKFKKGNKIIKRYIHLSIYHHYTNDKLIKEVFFKKILSYLLPYEQYIFAKTSKDTLIKFMKIKGSEIEKLLDKYNSQKYQIEKKLNKNSKARLNKNNFFENENLLQIFKLLNDKIYLEIFNDKTKTPNDNIIFVYKLFFLLIKNTENLVQLNNKKFWEKICDYFINRTNEFSENDMLLGELIHKLMKKKLNSEDENLKRIYEIIIQIDLRQLDPATFSKISPTTSQFCYIIKYFLEFFNILRNELNPLENEYLMIKYKIQKLIKKINRIGLYIFNLKYKDSNNFI